MHDFLNHSIVYYYWVNHRCQPNWAWSELPAAVQTSKPDHLACSLFNCLNVTNAAVTKYGFKNCFKCVYN